MMPAALTTQPTPTPLREGVNLFGDAESGQPTRVEVPVSVCLSYLELLGLLLFTPGLELLEEELNDDDALRGALRFALLVTDVTTVELYYAARAAEMLKETPRSVYAPSVDYVRRLGAAVTRVFGVAA
jgi:hypothetical protein